MRHTNLFLKTLLAVIGVELLLELSFGHSGASGAMRVALDTAILAVFAAPIIYYFLIRELKALQRERESFKNTGRTASLVLNSVGEGVYGMDLKGNVIFSNKAADEMLGYHGGGILGMNSHSLFHHTRADGSEYPAGDCSIYAAARDGKTRHVSDEVFWKKDGSPLQVEYVASPAMEDGKITGVIVAFKDVTERRRTERGIRLLHASTRIISDAPDLQTAMKLVLKEICEAGGWSAGEAFSISRDGKRLECAVIWSPEADRLKNFIKASEKSVFRKGEGLPGRVWTSLEPAWIRNVTQDPNFPRLRAAAEDGLKGAISVPVLADGEFVMALDFFSRRELSGLTDVQTDFMPAIAAQLGHRILRKQAEDARKAAMEQMVHGQKMESLGRTAGAIAHDFNNILTGTKGFVSLALETIPQDAQAANYIRQAADGINRGAALTQQLLAFSRNQASEMSELDLNAVIKGMDAMLNMLFQHRIRLVLALDPELPKIRGNKSQLEQVLMNLAVNARDAMSGSGEFAITTLSRPEESGRACSAEYEVTGRTIRLSVSDTGPGIPESIIDKIFEPFFTTKAEGKGTGMGLSTVYALVKTHKGGISVTSRPGRTTFDICFPAAVRPEPVKS